VIQNSGKIKKTEQGEKKKNYLSVYFEITVGVEEEIAGL
jgi:hypothetical protein